MYLKINITIKLNLTGWAPWQSLLVIEHQHVSASNLLEDGFVWDPPGDALVDILPTPVSVLRLWYTVSVVCHDFLMVLGLVVGHLGKGMLGVDGTLVLEHLQIHVTLLNCFSLLVPQMLVDGFSKNWIVFLGHG